MTKWIAIIGLVLVILGIVGKAGIIAVLGFGMIIGAGVLRLLGKLF